MNESTVKRTFSVTLDPETIARLDRQSSRETMKTGYFVSRSRLVERLLEDGLRRIEPRDERARQIELGNG